MNSVKVPLFIVLLVLLVSVVRTEIWVTQQPDGTASGSDILRYSTTDGAFLGSLQYPGSSADRVNYYPIAIATPFGLAQFPGFADPRVYIAYLGPSSIDFYLFTSNPLANMGFLFRLNNTAASLAKLQFDGSDNTRLYIALTDVSQILVYNTTSMQLSTLVANTTSQLNGCGDPNALSARNINGTGYLAYTCTSSPGSIRVINSQTGAYINRLTYSSSGNTGTPANAPVTDLTWNNNNLADQGLYFIARPIVNNENPLSVYPGYPSNYNYVITNYVSRFGTSAQTDRLALSYNNILYVSDQNVVLRIDLNTRPATVTNPLFTAPNRANNNLAVITGLALTSDAPICNTTCPTGYYCIFDMNNRTSYCTPVTTLSATPIPASLSPSPLSATPSSSATASSLTGSAVSSPTASSLTGSAVSSPTASSLTGSVLASATASTLTGSTVSSPTASTLTGSTVSSLTASSLTGSAVSSPTASSLTGSVLASATASTLTGSIVASPTASTLTGSTVASLTASSLTGSAVSSPTASTLTATPTAATPTAASTLTGSTVSSTTASTLTVSGSTVSSPTASTLTASTLTGTPSTLTATAASTLTASTVSSLTASTLTGSAVSSPTASTLTSATASPSLTGGGGNSQLPISQSTSPTPGLSGGGGNSQLPISQSTGPASNSLGPVSPSANPSGGGGMTVSFTPTVCPIKTATPTPTLCPAKTPSPTAIIPCESGEDDDDMGRLEIEINFFFADILAGICENRNSTSSSSGSSDSCA